MNRVRKLSLTTTLATATALMGCSSPGPVRPASPTELQASFPALRATFQANFPTATSVAGADLSLSAEVATDSFKTLESSKTDFLRWCARSGGTPYRDRVLAKPPQDVANAMAAATAILRHSGRLVLLASEPAACATATETYVLALGARGVGRDAAYAGNSVLTWLTPADIAARGPAALQAEAQQRKEQREQEARKEATRQAAAAKTYQEAMGRKAQLLDRSSVGTQRSCTGFMQSGQSMNQLSYDCGDDGYKVRFEEFSQHGWRITSQMATPTADVIGRAATNITLIVEKAR